MTRLQQQVSWLDISSMAARGGDGDGGGGGVMHQGIGESSGRNGGYAGRAGNDGGYGQGHGVGMGAPPSPVSSDGMVINFDYSGNQFGMDTEGFSGRKRIIDGVVERRQRRMIKNKESAARSRARKQVPLFVYNY
ncbi:PREDICTED: protein ABSCISIC ACID-INSENSITIVE 5-like [Populus euphratica]|uniref:Protein ABSCISIC ACID-INSENSITIVE 5-like n=1 Tax=Populus euphratica TaxID=75702 RepID=A0AAJ6XZH6_POPEU|nr:PREDICTED: protein ABSCISIC ACID-INSENSITIVE 5-like [Populus euphratica]